MVDIDNISERQTGDKDTEEFVVNFPSGYYQSWMKMMNPLFHGQIEDTSVIQVTVVLVGLVLTENCVSSLFLLKEFVYIHDFCDL